MIAKKPAAWRKQATILLFASNYALSGRFVHGLRARAGMF
jgi:hypothetical protein